jgi:transposase
VRNEGGAYLREQGIYSSQITEWRKLRDAGVLEGKKPGERIGRLSPEQAEIARLRREIEDSKRRLATTEVALEIMSKTHELLAELSKSSRDEPPHTKH